MIINQALMNIILIKLLVYNLKQLIKVKIILVLKTHNKLKYVILINQFLYQMMKK